MSTHNVKISDAVAKQKAQPSKPVPKAAPKAVPKPAPKPAPKAAPKAVPKPAPKSDTSVSTSVTVEETVVAESVAESVEESVVVESVVEPVVEPVEESVVVEPVEESVVEPVAESVVEPVEESVVEPVEESVVEPVEESVKPTVVTNNNEDIKARVLQSQQYRDRMTTALTNFLSLYNRLSSSPVDINLKDNKTYTTVIRTIGHYLYTVNIADWITSTITFGDDINMSLSLNVFSNTSYQASVETFLTLLNEAFNSNLDKEINQYLSETTDFTDDEKKICYEFHEKLSILNDAMKRGIFKDSINSSVTSKESISTYSTELNNFNEYNKIIRSDPDKMDIVMRFNKVLPSIASKKVQPNIFFDA